MSGGGYRDRPPVPFHRLKRKVEAFRGLEPPPPPPPDPAAERHEAWLAQRETLAVRLGHLRRFLAIIPEADRLQEEAPAEAEERTRKLERVTRLFAEVNRKLPAVPGLEDDGT